MWPIHPTLEPPAVRRCPSSVEPVYGVHTDRVLLHATLLFTVLTSLRARAVFMLVTTYPP
jgi:hypothetical protein